ncbi:hypothetical protein L218DRAFT_968341, partial [Marasmius fiardii PR-910]
TCKTNSYPTSYPELISETTVERVSVMLHCNLSLILWFPTKPPCGRPQRDIWPLQCDPPNPISIGFPITVEELSPPGCFRGEFLANRRPFIADFGKSWVELSGS